MIHLSLLRSRFTVRALALVAATAGLAAQAQTSADPNAQPGVRVAQAGTASTTTRSSYATGNDAYSLLPGTRRGYFGIHLGQADIKTSCGTGLYECDKPKTAVGLYTGGLFNDWVGMEIGYMNTGKADRAGGTTRAEGINVSAVLRAPLGQFNVFAKGGAIYGQTKVSSALLSGVPEGKRRGWGPVYGGGVGFDFTPTSGLVLEWSRAELKFPGSDGRQDVDTTSLGYVHRF